MEAYQSTTNKGFLLVHLNVANVTGQQKDSGNFHQYRYGNCMMKKYEQARSRPGPYIRSALLRRDEVPSFTKYPFSIPAILHLSELSLHPKVTFLVGENGSGKSTLLEAIAVACGFNPEGGSRNFTFNTRASHSELANYLTAVREPAKPTDGFFFRAESFFNLATEIERLDEDWKGNPLINSYGGTYLHEQSHGESFFSLFMHRFRGNSLFILDEPEAALSPNRQLALLKRMDDLVKAGSQFIIATHSPLLIAYPDSKVITLSEEGCHTLPYDETDVYVITKQFLNNPQMMIKSLLETDG